MAKIFGYNIGDIPGMFKDYAGGAVPSNYLLCDGSSYLISQYPALYAALGGGSSPYGSVDGFTLHFNVPDSRRKAHIGSGGTAISGPSNTTGSTGGSETHTLTGAESGMPSHQHAMDDQIWTNYSSTNGNEGTLNSGAGSFNCTTNTTGGGNRGTKFNQFAPAQNASSAHTIMQPSLVVTKIIKF